MLHVGLVLIFLAVLYYEVMRWGSQRQENRLCASLESWFRCLFRPCFDHLAYVDERIKRRSTTDILEDQREKRASLAKGEDSVTENPVASGSTVAVAGLEEHVI